MQRNDKLLLVLNNTEYKHHRGLRKYTDFQHDPTVNYRRLKTQPTLIQFYNHSLFLALEKERKV